MLHTTDQTTVRAIGRYPAGRHGAASRARAAAALALAVALVVPGAARAAPGCSVNVSGDVLFGTYDVFSPTPRDSSVRVKLTCPRGVAQILIGKGNSTTYAYRLMTSGADVLRYNLYLDPGFQTIWGDGTDGSSVYSSPSGNAQVQMYARIPAGQDAAAGAYADSLVVTVLLL